MARWGGRRITLIPYSTGSIRIFQIVPTTDISMIGVKNELDETDYSAGEEYTNISLTELSDGTDGTINNSNSADDRPDGVAPHALSEFANYDHDFAGASAPTSLAYTATSTGTITFSFTDPSSATRVYFYQGTGASFSGISAGQPYQFNGSTFVAVDESGTTSIIVNDGADDQFYNANIPSYMDISLGPNDFMDVKYKGYLGGAYSGFTVLWGAPEVTHNGIHSLGSDVYSLGIVLYEVLTGRVPFDEFDHLSNELLSDEIKKGLRPSLPEELPEELKLLLTKMWSSRLERPSATYVLEELVKFSVLLSP